MTIDNKNGSSEEINKIERDLNAAKEDFLVLLRHGLIELKRIKNKNRSQNKEIIIERPSFRIKDVNSIYEKIRRKKIESDNFLIDLKDLIGIRVISLDLSGIEMIFQELKESPFIEIIQEKRWIEKPDFDGYRGIHLIFTVKDKSLLKNPDLKGEIQIRTIAQHFWASFSHRDVYKSNRPLFTHTSERIQDLSDYLYRAEKEVLRLESDIKENPLQINEITLISFFSDFGFKFDGRDIQEFTDLLSQYGFKKLSIPKLQFGLTIDKNLCKVDIHDIEEWIHLVYKGVDSRNASQLEEFLCRLHAFYRGFYWPKRRTLELILKMFIERWKDILGSEYSQDLILLLEAAYYQTIERFIFTWESKDKRSMSWSPFIDNRYTVKRLTEIGLIEASLNQYQIKKEKEDGIFAKHTYNINCTPKGLDIARICKEKLFKNDEILSNILESIEIEDFPEGKKWIALKASVGDLKIIPADKGPNFIDHEWWSDDIGFY